MNDLGLLFEFLFALTIVVLPIVVIVRLIAGTEDLALTGTFEGR